MKTEMDYFCIKMALAIGFISGTFFGAFAITTILYYAGTLK
jgi:hypothetical protein